MRLSDRGGASQLIGSAWSDVSARVLSSWVGTDIPTESPALSGGRVLSVHRLDTIAGVASRASKAGLKNPDFVVFAVRNESPLVFGVDAKFSVETARPVQVSAETTTQLFEQDEHLGRMLPDPDPDATYVGGLFVSPDYSLTHVMFEHKMGHRRLTVLPDEVVLADVKASELFQGVASDAIIECLITLDGTTFPVWESVLAAQYYFRLERAIVGIVAEEQKPLLGTLDIDASEDDLLARISERPRDGSGAWQVILDWDRDVEHLRRQRQALHQVVGAPLSSSELRDISDKIMDEMGLEARPSRNRIRNALGARFAGEVLDEVGVIVPPVPDFPAELERVAAVARRISDAYVADIRGIVAGIIKDLVAENR